MRRAALLFLLALLALAACRGRAEDWVGGVEAAHHEADRRLAAKDVAGAREALRHAAESTLPSTTSARDARVVRQDLYARLATIALEAGDARSAAEDATRGLDLGREKDVFTSNLLIVRGKALEAQGDTSGASRDYHDALVVTEALLDQSLGDGAR